MTTDQIAAEAAEEIANAIGLDPQGSKTGTCIAIIKDAIERAVEPWEKAYHEILLERDSLARQQEESRAAQWSKNS